MTMSLDPTTRKHARESYTQFGKRRLIKTKGKQIDKREKFKIIIDGKDYTPKPLVEGEPIALDEPIPPVDAIFGGLSVSGVSSVFMGSGGLKSKVQASAAFGSSRDVSISQMVDTSLQDPVELLRIDSKLSLVEPKDKVPSQFLLPKYPYLKSPPVPKKLLVTLTETPTFFHFELRSSTEPTGTPSGAEVKQINDRYVRRLEEAKNSVTKKSSDMETQTPVIFMRNQKTLLQRCERSNNEANVTTYDIYKTHVLLRKMKKSLVSGKIVQDPMKMKLKKKEKEEVGFNESLTSEGGPSGESSFVSMSNFSDDKAMKIAEASVSVSEEEKREQEVIALFQTKRFKTAVFFIERMLASNVFEKEQETFKGIIKEDIYRMDVEFNYRLDLLWTYTNDHVRGRSITSVSWNKMNENLLAVGYGKYYYRDRRGGIVCVWCIKNPVQPERMYKFVAPVQAVDFSKTSPNLLAVGFYNGDIAVLDVSNIELSIVAQNDRESMISFAPIWRVLWFPGEEHDSKEQIMTAGQDGRIFKYKRSKTFLCFPMMRMTRSEGKTRGIPVPRKCDPHDIPISCHPPALAIALHPKDHVIYFVGTAEGGVHRCSINYLSHHLEMFIAHRGPVYNLEFSPFSETIFLTCGADFCIRIWQDGIGDPLFSLSLTGSRDPVLDATWSPINASIIASISGSQIHIWDISRKISAPVSTTDSPTPITPTPRLSTIRFEKSGRNLVVGDIRGRIHLFALKEMPFPPFFQEEALVRSVTKALATRPDLYKELRKKYPLFEELADVKKCD